MKLALVFHTRPDVQYEVFQLAQVTKDVFNEKRKQVLKFLNFVLKYELDHVYVIYVPTLDSSSLQVTGFSDASFANNRDNTTQLGYIIFLAHKNNNTGSIHYKSKKACRIVRSVLGGELIEFVDMFDYLFTATSELRCLHPGSTVPVSLHTDRKSLVVVISKASRTSKR